LLQLLQPAAAAAAATDDDDDDDDNNDDNNDDTNSEFSSVRSVQQSEESKTRRRDKRGSMMEYVKPKTSFSKNTYEKTLVEHQRAQREHGTLSGKLMSHKQVLTGMSRIMMSYLQVVAVARSVPIAWPSAVVDTLDAFSVVSAPSLSLVSIDCALNSEDADSLKSGLNNEAAASAMKPIYGKFIMTMMVPIMATLLPALFWGLFYLFGTCCVQKRSCKKCCKWKETITEEDKSWYNLHDLVSVNKHELKKSVFERFKVTLMVVFFLFYPTIVKGVLSMFSCQKFDTIQYLIADMSVQCWTDEHNTYVVLAAIFFVLYVVGIPAFGCFILHHFLPGVHYDPTLPIGTFNPVAGRAYERKDRAHLLQLKLEASAVYGFMWEGLQQKGLAPFWEWSVIMSRKAAIIAIILLLQNFSPQYQLTIALIVMFGYNLLHVKFHPYDLFYHDRLEFLSLISSEMTLFGGLVITFLDFDKERCVTKCLELKKNSETTAQGIGYAIIFFNVLYLTYFSMGLLLHGYYVLIPAKLRCAKVEKVAGDAHAKMKEIAPGAHAALFPNLHHKYRDNHALHTGNDKDVIEIKIEVDRIEKKTESDQKQLAKHLASGQKDAHKRVQERLLKKKKKKQKDSINIEMTEGKQHQSEGKNVVI